MLHLSKGVFSYQKNGFKDKKESNKHNVSILCIKSSESAFGVRFLLLFVHFISILCNKPKKCNKKFCGCNWLMCFVFGVIEKIN